MKIVMLTSVAAGGAIGAAARYLSASAAIRLLGPNFPWGTMFVNVLGSFVMGVLVELMALKINVSPPMRVFLITGVLGGFTTFSAFSLDVAVLVEKKAHISAGFYAAASVGLSVLALFAGLMVVRAYLS